MMSSKGCQCNITKSHHCDVAETSWKRCHCDATMWLYSQVAKRSSSKHCKRFTTVTFQKVSYTTILRCCSEVVKKNAAMTSEKSHHRNEKKDIAMPHWHRAKTMTSQKCHKQRHKKVTSMTSQKVHRCNITETARTVHHHNVAKQPNCNVAATSQNGRYRDIVKSCSKVVKDCQNNIVKQLLLQRRQKNSPPWCRHPLFSKPS